MGNGGPSVPTDRRRYDWTDRFPVIVEAAGRLPTTSFLLDAKAVVLRDDGTSDFDRLHSRRDDAEVQLLGFDLLEPDGLDVRPWPLERRKDALSPSSCAGCVTASSSSSIAT